MKAVILAGGLGTRMGDETAARPKPLVDIGGRPILWHILKIYQAHGIRDFVVCAGYQGARISEFFARPQDEDWRVQVVDTGLSTATGGRLKRVRDLVADGPFCMTYGDAVSNVDISALVRFHLAQGVLATVTAVQPRMPFGVVTFPQDGGGRVGFREKPWMHDLWVNGGFFVIDPAGLDSIDRDDQAWEDAPLSRLADSGQLAGYQHTGYWQCMDAPRDRQALEDLWRQGQPPWKVW